MDLQELDLLHAMTLWIYSFYSVSTYCESQDDNLPTVNIKSILSVLGQMAEFTICNDSLDLHDLFEFLYLL